MQISQNMQLESEVYDLTITEKETTLQNSLEKTLESDENSEDTSMGDNLEYEFHYGIFIKLNGKLQPAKYYKVVVSGIDEFLVEIHANVIALAQNELFFRIAIMSKIYYTLFKYSL
ncbi:unnamed protein product [Rhizophagus irregularis]|uniref:Uncharacterized protein n=1 Tax=Rhizophagus irregularis TaxID=588596 RepID=A0A2I1G922_9GLOM|nr:hypothetical protein RhiirA4_417998 [Rhizophagus irregularis]CAB4436953.1 unnamed protein product [Rhizophagus irregularis]